jgi:uncharacterized protein YacL (UPF0231 family)
MTFTWGDWGIFLYRFKGKIAVRADRVGDQVNAWLNDDTDEDWQKYPELRQAIRDRLAGQLGHVI